MNAGVVVVVVEAAEAEVEVVAAVAVALDDDSGDHDDHDDRVPTCDRVGLVVPVDQWVPVHLVGLVVRSDRVLPSLLARPWTQCVPWDLADQAFLVSPAVQEDPVDLAGNCSAVAEAEAAAVVADSSAVVAACRSHFVLAPEPEQLEEMLSVCPSRHSGSWNSLGQRPSLERK